MPQKENIIESIITSPSKLMFTDPQVTKAEVANYYAAVYQRMEEHISKRILSLVCCPRGVDKSECFFKKHLAKKLAGTHSIIIPNSNNKPQEYFYIDSLNGLMEHVQNNTIEFHTWCCRVDTELKPDVMVFDLDPDEGMDLARIRQGVVDLKEVLDGLSLTSFLKTSGGKGYHVCLPFSPSCDFDTFKTFARNIAIILEKTWSNRYTTNIRKASRKGKIFIDYLRNGKGATSIAPYSLRARAGAKVSLPIDYNELYEIAPNAIDIHSATKRLTQKDPWKAFAKTAKTQSISPSKSLIR